jgi:Ala-tRNA(Pro) deacylase
MISTKLQEYLENARVPYTRHAHRAAYTSQEIAQAVHIPGRQMVKTVMLKPDEGPLVMAVLSANDTANLDSLREQIGCRVLRLAKESEFRDAFPTCTVGAMPPFGNIFDMPTYCHATLSQNPEIEFNAGTHDETIRMTFEDYKRLVNPTIAQFAQPYGEGVQRVAA